jgi:hypothetical protein
MPEVIHRYIGKDGKIPKPTVEQKERQGSDARLAAAKAREREAIAALREAELARKRGELGGNRPPSSRVKPRTSIS